MTFGSKLRSARELKALSRAEAATRLRHSVGALQWWESDKCLPRLRALRAISRLYGIDLHELTTEWTTARIEHATKRIAGAA